MKSFTVALPPLLLLLLATAGRASPLSLAAIPQLAETAAALSPSITADGSRHYRWNPSSTTAVAITFPTGALAVSIENEDPTNALLVRFIRHGKIVADELGELGAPADNAWSEVQPIPAGRTLVFDIRRSIGIILDKPAGTSGVTIRCTD